MGLSGTIRADKGEKAFLEIGCTPMEVGMPQGFTPDPRAAFHPVRLHVSSGPKWTALEPFLR